MTSDAVIGVVTAVPSVLVAVLGPQFRGRAKLIRMASSSTYGSYHRQAAEEALLATPEERLGSQWPREVLLALGIATSSSPSPRSSSPTCDIAYLEALHIAVQLANRLHRFEAAKVLQDRIAVIESAPTERRNVIAASFSMLDAGQATARRGDAGGHRIIALNRLLRDSYHDAPTDLLARLTLGESPVMLSGSKGSRLSRREAHSWMSDPDHLEAAEWLLRKSNMATTSRTHDVAVARWFISAMSDPMRKAALIRNHDEVGPHGEVISGSYCDHINQLCRIDLRRSVEDSFRNAMARMWRNGQRVALNHPEPLREAPAWWCDIPCSQLLLSAADLANEGRELHHCVGGYAQDVSSGKLLIVSLRVPERTSSGIMIRRSTVSFDATTLQVLQHRGSSNEQADPICQRALAVLIRRLQLRRIG